MNIYVPWGLIAIFIAFYVSYSHNRRTKLKRQERKENLENRNQELLDYLHRSREKRQISNDTTAEESSEQE